MLITTTPNVEGKRIDSYLGVIAGEAILGANVFRVSFAGIREHRGWAIECVRKGARAGPHPCHGGDGGES